MQNIKKQIQIKNSPNLYLTSVPMVITEYSSFPYRHWYKNNPFLPISFIDRREAGWYPRKTNTYVYKPKCNYVYCDNQYHYIMDDDNEL